MTVVDEIFSIFGEQGGSQYFGENVSQLEHALQAAALAQRDGRPETLIVAALLHDVGHLLHSSPENVADHGIDTRHEDLGDRWLAHAFGPAITEPVRLHVAAKRYMCAVEPDYLAKLSPASVQSLHLQGGPMSPGEVTQFEANPFFREAVQLRGYDDEAKIVGWDVPALDHYRTLIERHVTPISRLSSHPISHPISH